MVAEVPVVGFEESYKQVRSYNSHAPGSLHGASQVSVRSRFGM